MDTGAEESGVGPVRQFLSLRRDVLVLSVAMFAFSLAFQMTTRYVPEYLRVLGVGAGIVGLYGSLGNLIAAVYPYPGGALSDRIGSRYALTLFGTATTAGFAVWLFAPALAAGVLPPWIPIFLGLFLTQAWKSLGLGATFAIVKQSVASSRLATGFASTETFRRVGFLVGPLLATAVLAATTDFVSGFQRILLVAVAFGTVATAVQHVLYEAEADTVGKEFAGVDRVITDLRAMPETLRPLLVADTLVRFGNGMVYVFFVWVVTDYLSVPLDAFGVSLEPAAYFGVLQGVEMAVALATMLPVAKLAERVGLKPVVAAGFAVYAAFPVLFVFTPPDQWVVAALFAFSGLRFAGLPAHKALIVGPAERDAGGRVTGSYYLVRNVLVVPSAALGGWLYAVDPRLAFGSASAVGLLGVAYFLAFGEEFEATA